MKIFLLRHGRTAYNDLRRYQGKLDLPLSREGAEELSAADFSPARVYVSPLLRARQTARILFPTAEQIVVEAFAEMDFGDFDGRSADEMAGDAAYRAWVEGGCTGRCPNGESLAEFCARSCRAFSALLDRAAAEKQDRLVVLAHSGTLRAVMERFSLPPCGYFEVNPPPGGGFVLDCEPAARKDGRRLVLLETVQYGKEETGC